MRILSITAQKPSSTGSGVYLTELVREFARKGHSQAVVAGVYREDQISLPAEVGFYPVYFQTEILFSDLTAILKRTRAARSVLSRMRIL